MSELLWHVLRRVLFQLDAERAHRLVMHGLKHTASLPFPCLLSKPSSSWPSLSRTLFGLTFPNPLGLAAGFDKNAEVVPALQNLGFGFIEVGTVTAQPQVGNPKPRLFRLTADEALLNRLGFNNDGAAVVAKRLERHRKRYRLCVPIGVNIGKSKSVSLEEAPVDYRISFSAIADVADYVVVNVSSPNTPRLRDLQGEQALARLLDVVMDANRCRTVSRPVLLKLAPDLDDVSAVACVQVAIERGLVGIIVSNTTTAREGLRGPIPGGAGGISGRPLFRRSTELLKMLKSHFGTAVVFIGVGGIMNGEMAQEKLSHGADLLQVYTGFVYGGPSFPQNVLDVLVAQGKA